MLEIKNVEVTGWEAAIRGMRNPMNSWDKSDSEFVAPDGKSSHTISGEEGTWHNVVERKGPYIGPNDLKLMIRLSGAGTDHRKFMRMIAVYADITAPLYWWKEADTYKVGTVANSCSTMHKITEKPFELSQFSCENLLKGWDSLDLSATGYAPYAPMEQMLNTIDCLNFCRERYLETKNKVYWWQLIQLLPASYNQLRTVMLNYEVLANIYQGRRNHKLDEWHTFCGWIEELPYSGLIKGLNREENDV